MNGENPRIVVKLLFALCRFLLPLCVAATVVELGYAMGWLFFHAGILWVFLASFALTLWLVVATRWLEKRTRPSSCEAWNERLAKRMERAP